MNASNDIKMSKKTGRNHEAINGDNLCLQNDEGFLSAFFFFNTLVISNFFLAMSMRYFYSMAIDNKNGKERHRK